MSNQRYAPEFKEEAVRNTLYVRTMSFILAVLSCCLTSPAHASEPTPSAQSTVLAWLNVVDAGHYDRSWTDTSAAFQAKVSQTKWITLAGKARKPLGPLKRRELLGAAYEDELPRAGTGDYIIFQFQSKFARKPKAVETVTVVLENGAWRIAGYFVRNG
ncbi:MAG: DUF4019 domain-containing protein [Pseudomonadota bacterium]